jgi:hypothetical protein
VPNQAAKNNYNYKQLSFKANLGLIKCEKKYPFNDENVPGIGAVRSGHVSLAGLTGVYIDFCPASIRWTFSFRADISSTVQNLIKERIPRYVMAPAIESSTT